MRVYLNCQIVQDWKDNPRKSYTFEYDLEDDQNLEGKRGYAMVGKNNRIVKVKIKNKVNQPKFVCKPILIILD